MGFNISEKVHLVNRAMAAVESIAVSLVKIADELHYIRSEYQNRMGP